MRARRMNRFFRIIKRLPDNALKIKAFTIVFGNADKETMDMVAEATGGRVFDAKIHTLDHICQQIRGYQ